jgi:hypothetical protein
MVIVTRPALIRDDIEALVCEYHHLQSEHRLAGLEGSVRRHQHARLLELEERFERLLEEWVGDEETRRAWREHLHHGAPAPLEPEDAPLALVFKGRSAAGSVAEIRERPDGDYDVVVDGAVSERIAGEPDFAGRTPRFVFRLGDLEFREIFGASAPALAALRAFVAEASAEPPWQYARELMDDGLIDRDFALTPRGRRALATAP